MRDILEEYGTGEAEEDADDREEGVEAAMQCYFSKQKKRSAVGGITSGRTGDPKSSKRGDSGGAYCV
jgi:hypothetical protein